MSSFMVWRLDQSPQTCCIFNQSGAKRACGVSRAWRRLHAFASRVLIGKFVLKQRQKATRKWPIALTLVSVPGK